MEYTDRELLDKAKEAMVYSYSPYSRFKVGACVLTKDGHIYTGCNIENSSFGATNCAERTAFFKAVSEGVQDFEAICIVGGRNQKPTGYTAPCGVCRQVMMEFCNPKTFKIILAIDRENYRVYTLEDMLPQGFGPANLE